MVLMLALAASSSRQDANLQSNTCAIHLQLTTQLRNILLRRNVRQTDAADRQNGYNTHCRYYTSTPINTGLKFLDNFILVEYYCIILLLPYINFSVRHVDWWMQLCSCV